MFVGFIQDLEKACEALRAKGIEHFCDVQVNLYGDFIFHYNGLTFCVKHDTWEVFRRASDDWREPKWVQI